MKTRKKTKKNGVRPAVGKKPDIPGGLSPEEFAFCVEYLANGFNASAAYRKVHPTCQENSSWALGYRRLRNVKVRAYLNPLMEAAWRLRQVSGDEVLARVGLDATVDIRAFFDADGELLKPHDWPDEVAGCVKGFEVGKKLQLVDPLQARRIILEQTGKLKSVAGAVDSLAEAIRADQERNRKP